MGLFWKLRDRHGKKKNKTETNRKGAPEPARAFQGNLIPKSLSLSR